MDSLADASQVTEKKCERLREKTKRIVLKFERAVARGRLAACNWVSEDVSSFIKCAKARARNETGYQSVESVWLDFDRGWKLARVQQDTRTSSSDQSLLAIEPVSEDYCMLSIYVALVNNFQTKKLVFVFIVKIYLNVSCSWRRANFKQLSVTRSLIF